MNLYFIAMKDEKAVTYKIEDKAVWEVKTWEIILPKNVADLLNSSHEKISEIADIEWLESQETNPSKIFIRASRDYIYWILWITIDPAIFAQMTETLNKHRSVMSNWIADNYYTEDKKVSNW